MMKVLGPVVWSLAVASVARADVTLRGSTAHDVMGETGGGLKADTGYNGLTLFLDHVKAGSAVSDDVVVDAIVKSYNKVHDGYSIISAFKYEEIAIPEDGTNGAYYDSLGRYTVGWECSACAEDEGFLPPLYAVAQASPGLHQKFVDELCGALRDSGKEAFASIAKCAVDFTYGMVRDEPAKDATTKTTSLTWPWSHKSGGKDADGGGEHHGMFMAAELDVHQVLSGGDMNIGDVTKAFMDAYNEVHADTPYRIERFSVDREIDLPEDNGDEDEGGEGDEDTPPRMLGNHRPRVCYTCRYRGWMGSGSYGCTMCRDDRSALPPMSMLIQYKESRLKVVEKLFCHKLLTSGDLTFQHARDCRINLVIPNGDGSVPALELG